MEREEKDGGGSEKRGASSLSAVSAGSARDVLSVVLFKGSGRAERPYERVLPCARRGSTINLLLTAVCSRLGGWRYGFGSGYQTEQTTFAWRLIPELRRGGFDIVHLQDPWLAWLLRKAYRAGRQPAKVILAHGTEESPEFLGGFQYVQHLAPWHMEEARNAERGVREEESRAEHAESAEWGSRNAELGTRNQEEDSISNSACHNWFTIPNFVDTEKYRPGRNPGLRERLKIPEAAFVVLSVAAIAKSHKRIDHLIREFARLQNSSLSRAELAEDAEGATQCGKGREGDIAGGPFLAGPAVGARTLSPSDNGGRHSPQSTVHNPQLFLLIAGARTNETGALVAMAEELVPGRAVFLPDYPHDKMPELYRVADIFVMCSLKEMMPIALLEAMASGLTVIANRHPVLQWMIRERNEDGSLKPETTIGYEMPETGERGLMAVQRELAGGVCVDMSREGALTEAILRYYRNPALREIAGAKAREQAVRLFAKDVVMDRIVEMYRTVGCGL